MQWVALSPHSRTLLVWTVCCFYRQSKNVQMTLHSHQYKCECVWGCSSICRPCDRLATCPWRTLPSLDVSSDWLNLPHASLRVSIVANRWADRCCILRRSAKWGMQSASYSGDVQLYNIFNMSVLFFSLYSNSDMGVNCEMRLCKASWSNFFSLIPSILLTAPQDSITQGNSFSWEEVVVMRKMLI